ncbi:MAG: response regulator [Elusimicrobia bacterium]|nr:response regulator [Elusimicrobiota bacterium]
MEKQPCILLVDDDPSWRAMLGLSLRQAGFQVDMAGGGDEALGLLRRRRYDFLLTDGRMLPMDGLELSRQAQRVQPGLRVVLVSAVSSAQDAAGYPIEKVFPKPLQVDALLGWLGAPTS